MSSTHSRPFATNPEGDMDITVTKLLVHPIKSCHGTSVQESKYSPLGLEFDRTFMVVDSETRKTVTARDIPAMVLIYPIVQGDQLVISFPDSSSCPTFNVRVSPSADDLSKWQLLSELDLWKESLDGYVVQFSPESPLQESSPSQILSDYLGRPVQLVYQGPTPRPVVSTDTHPSLHETSTAVYHDGYPLLIASTESIKKVQESVHQAARGEEGWKNIGGLDSDRWSNDEVVIERFRPNIVVSGAKEGFDEDQWKDVQIGDGDTIISCVSRCARCVFPNIDPVSADKDKAIPYKVISKFRRVDPAHPYSPCFGVHACPTSSGVIRVGDKLRILNRADRETVGSSNAK